MLHASDYATKLLAAEHMEIKNIEVTVDQITMFVTMKWQLSE